MGRRLVEEEQKIQTLLAQRDKRPEVDVFRVKNGRWVEIILTSGAADSLASMDITSPPAGAKRRATSLVRDLKTSYEDFGTVQAVEVGFAKQLTVDGVGVGQSARMIFDEDALRKLGN